MTDKTYGPDKITIEQMHSKNARAFAAGHSHYFTGVLCKHGHLSPRRTINNRCQKCEKISYETRRIPKPHRKKTAEEKAKKRSQYWEDNKEMLSKKHSEWVQANPERERARDRARYKKNREKSIARTKAYYQENREIILEKRKEYRRKNKEKISQQNKAYYLGKKKALLPQDL